MDALRQTGRTTALITRANDLLKEGKAVVVIAHNSMGAARISRMLPREVRVLSDGNPLIDWRRLHIQGTHDEDAHILVDHYAWENRASLLHRDNDRLAEDNRALQHELSKLREETERLSRQLADAREGEGYNATQAVWFEDALGCKDMPLGVDAHKAAQEKLRDLIADKSRLEEDSTKLREDKAELVATLIELRDWYTMFTGLPAANANAALAKHAPTSE